MTLLQFLGFHLISTGLKLTWFFYNERQKSHIKDIRERNI